MNRKNKNDVTTWQHDVITKFFWRHFISLVKFSYWSMFYVNIMSGFGVNTIFFYKRLTRNPEIGNIAIWVLPNIWRLDEVRDIKYGTNFSNEMLLNAAKCQSYSFYHFWVTKRKPTRGMGGGVNSPPTPPGVGGGGQKSPHPHPSRLGLKHMLAIFLQNFKNVF